jgi:hypothetical protein
MTPEKTPEEWAEVVLNQMGDLAPFPVHRRIIADAIRAAVEAAGKQDA